MQNGSQSSLLIDFIQEKGVGYRRIFQRLPLISNISVGWDDWGIAIAYDRQPPTELPKVSCKQHCIAILTDMPSTPVLTERIIDGRFMQEQNLEGECIIHCKQ